MFVQIYPNRSVSTSPPKKTSCFLWSEEAKLLTRFPDDLLWSRLQSPPTSDETILPCHNAKGLRVHPTLGGQLNSEASHIYVESASLISAVLKDSLRFRQHQFPSHPHFHHGLHRTRRCRPHPRVHMYLSRWSWHSQATRHRLSDFEPHLHCI